MQEKNASEIYKLGYIIRRYKNSVNLRAKNIKVPGLKVQGLAAFGGIRVQRLRRPG